MTIDHGPNPRPWIKSWVLGRRDWPKSESCSSAQTQRNHFRYLHIRDVRDRPSRRTSNLVIFAPYLSNAASNIVRFRAYTGFPRGFDWWSRRTEVSGPIGAFNS